MGAHEGGGRETLLKNDLRARNAIHDGHKKANQNQTQNFFALLHLKLGMWEVWVLKFVVSYSIQLPSYCTQTGPHLPAIYRTGVGGGACCIHAAACKQQHCSMLRSNITRPVPTKDISMSEK